MSGFFYYLSTFAESVTSVFGIRFPYEQPHYAVIQELGQSVEVRDYDPRLAIEATVDSPDPNQAAGEAFGLLFRYITGTNQRDQKIAMTAPVRTASERIAMTVPVQTTPTKGSDGNYHVSMRFFLPKEVAEAGAPAPLDPRLHLVQVPASTIAALRYSGIATRATRDQKSAELLAVLAKSPWHPQGAVFQLSYDPPFAIPFLRRNEVAVDVTR
jgi:hypothetical protein